MQITIQLDTDSASDLAGLAALIAAIGSRTTGDVVVTGSQNRYARGEIDADESVRQVANVLTDDTGRPTQPSAGGEGSAPSAPSTGQTDSTGLPWDERIHSNPPSTTQDGKWRKRRGVTDETLAAVTAELTGASDAAPDAPTGTAGGASEADTAVPTPPTETPAPDTPDAPPPPADTASATPVATTAGDAPVVTLKDGSTVALTSYGVLVGTIQKNYPGVNYNMLNKKSDDLGVPAFKDLVKRPDLWAFFFDSLDVEG